MEPRIKMRGNRLLGDWFGYINHCGFRIADVIHNQLSHMSLKENLLYCSVSCGHTIN